MPDERRLPLEPLECRQKAEDDQIPPPERTLWALLGIAGELAEIRRELRRKR